MAENYFIHCRYIINECNLFSVSFKPSLLVKSIKKRCFQNYYDDIIRNFKTDMFPLTRVLLNIRNCKHIDHAKIEQEDCRLKMKEIIASLISHVIWCIPPIFPMKGADTQTRSESKDPNSFRVLNQEMNKFVLLHDATFDSIEIAKKLYDHLKRDIVVYKPNKLDPIHYIRNFNKVLFNSNHILVTNQVYFVGCDTPNVVYLLQRGNEHRLLSRQA